MFSRVKDKGRVVLFFSIMVIALSVVVIHYVYPEFFGDVKEKVVDDIGKRLSEFKKFGFLKGEIDGAEEGFE